MSVGHYVPNFEGGDFPYSATIFVKDRNESLVSGPIASINHC